MATVISDVIFNSTNPGQSPVSGDSLIRTLTWSNGNTQVLNSTYEAVRELYCSLDISAADVGQTITATIEVKEDGVIIPLTANFFVPLVSVSNMATDQLLEVAIVGGVGTKPFTVANQGIFTGDLCNALDASTMKPINVAVAAGQQMIVAIKPVPIP